MTSSPRILALASLLAAVAPAPGASAQTLIRQLDANSIGGGFNSMLIGSAVAPLGDLDGDGCTDLVLGGRGLYGVTSSSCLVVSGKSFTVLGALAPPAIPELSQFGAAVDGPGDIDGDGVPDILVGAPGGYSCSMFGCVGSTRGAASVHSGATFAALLSWQGSNELDLFGSAVAGVGDIDGDGVPDVAVAAPQRLLTPYLTGPGRVELYSGATGALLHTLTGAQVDDGFGWSVAGPGDVDGDGVRDVLVGAPWATGAAPGSGWVGLYRGSDGALLRSWSGAAAGDDFGHVAGIDDLDGDGLRDILVGAPGFDGPAGEDAGVVHAYSGASGAELLTLDGPVAKGAFGLSVAGIPDVNGDGRAELLAGSNAPGFNPAYFARLCSGRAGAVLYDLDDQVPAYAIGQIFLNNFGHVVAPAGDLNGDGIPDFLLAGPTKVVVGGDVIHIYGGQHVLAFSGAPIPVTSLAKPGASGSAGVPVLTGMGSTAPNELLALHLAQAAPGHPVFLVIGHGIPVMPVNTLKVWPALDAIVPLGPSDGQGQLEVSGRWPAALGFGEVLVAQAVVVDAGAPHGLATSNTLQLTSE